ncbi:MAG: M23 family metallopeptidase [Firmicutes bacterium]|nr:M23 family metallopeptidase [Bacillota bacterium]
MEHCDQRANGVERELPCPADGGEGESSALTNPTSSFERLEKMILKQIMVCIFIIFLLWVIGNIPGVGDGVIDRFRHVLKYGEAKRTEEKITAFAREHWHKVKNEVSSWFAVQFQPAMAPARRRIQLSSPLFYFEGREVYPDRIRFLTAPNSVLYASAAGIVRAISPEKGGWKVDLDHGEGWHSLYYPCPQVYVKTGEWVNPGQEIASTGREFFWMVTSGGLPVDPRLFVDEQGLWR